MPKLKVIDRNIIKVIQYTDKFGTGIFLVKDDKKAKNNCKVLLIEFGENTSPYENKVQITKLGKTVIVSERLLDNHFQYIFQDYADRSYLEDLLEQVHPNSIERLTFAFNATKMNALKDFEFLGGQLDNRN